jgi:hypothetical protein
VGGTVWGGALFFHYFNPSQRYLKFMGAFLKFERQNTNSEKGRPCNSFLSFLSLVCNGFIMVWVVFELEPLLASSEGR